MKPLPTYEPLSADDVAAVCDAALRVLEEVGVEAGASEAREVYARAGARVAGSRAFLPRGLVQDLVAKAPRQVILCGRDARHDLELSGTNVYVGSGGAALEVIDLAEVEALLREKRRKTVQAMANSAGEGLHLLDLRI